MNHKELENDRNLEMWYHHEQELQQQEEANECK